MFLLDLERFSLILIFLTFTKRLVVEFAFPRVLKSESEIFGNSSATLMFKQKKFKMVESLRLKKLNVLNYSFIISITKLIHNYETV